MEKQLDIFGSEVDIRLLPKQIRNHETPSIKAKFRSLNGTKQGYYCRDCKYFITCKANTRTYYKCQFMGIVENNTPEIRLSDVACNLYENEKKERI